MEPHFVEKVSGVLLPDEGYPHSADSFKATAKHEMAKKFAEEQNVEVEEVEDGWGDGRKCERLPNRYP